MRTFAQWLYATDASEMVRTAPGSIQLIQSVHFGMIALLLISLILTSFRLRGMAYAEVPLPTTFAKFGRIGDLAFVGLLATGLLMILAEPNRELTSSAFWIKLPVVIALFFIWRGRNRRVLAAEAVPSVALSLSLAAAVLIITAIFLGRWIAYSPTL